MVSAQGVRDNFGAGVIVPGTIFFDHLLAVLPEFGLRLYQAPGGADVAEAIGRLANAQGPGGDSGVGAEMSCDDAGLRGTPWRA